MRSRIYRNLDTPFQILGFNYMELTFLSITFVLANEIAKTFSLSTFWVLLITILLALVWRWIRSSLGQSFAKRLIRFIGLPAELRAHLFTQRRDDVRFE